MLNSCATHTHAQQTTFTNTQARTHPVNKTVELTIRNNGESLQQLCDERRIKNTTRRNFNAVFLLYVVVVVIVYMPWDDTNNNLSTKKFSVGLSQLHVDCISGLSRIFCFFLRFNTMRESELARPLGGCYSEDNNNKRNAYYKIH